jgi:hypothetical protein
MTIFTIFGIIGAIVSLLFLIQVLYILYILIVGYNPKNCPNDHTKILRTGQIKCDKCGSWAEENYKSEYLRKQNFQP